MVPVVISMLGVLTEVSDSPTPQKPLQAADRSFEPPEAGF